MLPVYAFLTLKVMVAIDLHFINHTVSAKNLLYCSAKEEEKSPTSWKA